MPVNWLRRLNARDLFLIFAGLFGLIILISISYTKYTRDTEKRKIAYQQALQEQQQEEERRQALETKKRLAVERQKREAQERLMLAQQTELRQLGVRGIPISTAPTDAYQNLGVWLKVQSAPEDADVYFNWEHKGRTPLWLRGAEIIGLLLLTKENHETWFRDISANKNGTLAANLAANQPPSRSQLLLTLAEGSSENAFAFLRSRLSDSGFSIPEASAAIDFQQMEQAAGGLSNAGLRAWARSKFAADVLLRASLRERHRDIGKQSRVLAGTVRVFVDLDFDVYDLRTGEHLAVITAAESAFGIDRMQGFEKALEAVTVDAVHKLQAQLKR